jgi:hypothetical protein
MESMLPKLLNVWAQMVTNTANSQNLEMMTYDRMLYVSLPFCVFGMWVLTCRTINNEECFIYTSYHYETMLLLVQPF